MFFICYDVTNDVTIKGIHFCVVLHPNWPTPQRWEFGNIGLRFGFALLPVHGTNKPVGWGEYIPGGGAGSSCVSNRIEEE